MAQLLWILGLSFILAFFLTPLFLWVAKKLNFYYMPTEVSVNRQPVPLLGGLAICLSFLIPLIITDQLSASTIGILIGGAILFVSGLLDDIFKLSSRVQLGVIFLAASIVVGYGVRIQFFSNPFGPDILLLQALSIPVTILWIVALTSSIKVMDGLDGLAAGICAISALTLFAVTWDNPNIFSGSPALSVASLALAGACLGFLPFNFFPAKIFMGESGVMFLGFILASLSVEGLLKRSFLISLSIPLLALGLPLFNTLFAIIRRGLKRRNILAADQEHVHDVLLKRGISHRRAVLTLYVISALLGFLSFLMTKVSALVALLIWIFLIAILSLGAWKLGLIGFGDHSKNSSE